MSLPNHTEARACSLRVCLLNEFFYPDDAGGTGTVLTELVSALRRDYPEISIDVITSRFQYRSGAKELDAFEEWNGVRIFRVNSLRAQGKRPPVRLAANAQFGAAVLRHLLRHKTTGPYDLVLVSTAPPTLVGIAHVYKMLTKTPFVYVVYDLEPDRAVVMNLLAPKGIPAQVLRRAQKRWLHSAAKVVVLGRCMQEYLQKNYHVPAPKIEAIPIGCDADTITVMPRHLAAFRKKQGLDDKFIVCYSGNFGRYHDFDTLLDAAKVLRQTDPAVAFVLVGGGAQRQHIVERVQSEAINNVHLFGFVERADYPDLLASADVSLITLEPGMEGLCVPSKFYSILASGRPVLAVMSPGCEVARVINEAQCGVRVDVADVDALVKTIRHLASDPFASASMGAKGRAVLDAQFTAPHVAKRYYQVLAQTAGCAAADAQPQYGSRHTAPMADIVK